MTDQNYLTLPANLREAADDLQRLSSSEEYWRFRNLMTWAADRIDTLQAEVAASTRPAQPVEESADKDIIECLRQRAESLMTVGGLHKRDLRVTLYRDAADRIATLGQQVAAATHATQSTPAGRIADVYYPLVLAFNATHVPHAGLARRERIGQAMLALPVEEYQRLFDMEQEVCRHRPAAELEEKLRRADLAMAEMAKTIEQLVGVDKNGVIQPDPSARTVPAGHCYPAEQHVVEDDGHGVTRFRQNRIVADLLTANAERRVGPDLNDVAIGVARGRYTIEERGEVNRLAGYSLCGFEDAFPIGDEDA